MQVKVSGSQYSATIGYGFIRAILILAGGNDKFVRLTENDKFINEHVFSISHEDFSTKISVNSL